MYGEAEYKINSNEFAEKVDSRAEEGAERKMVLNSTQFNRSLVIVSRSTAAELLKVADSEGRLEALGLRPAGVLRHESGTERPIYHLAEVTATRAKINADEIAELKRQREAIDAKIAALGGEVAP